MKDLIKFSIAVLIFFASMQMQAQTTYKIQGNEIVSIKKETVKAEPVKTNLTHTIKGVKYPVYQTANGKYFILRTSKKTNKEYKQYLKV